VLAISLYELKVSMKSFNRNIHVCLVAALATVISASNASPAAAFWGKHGSYREAVSACRRWRAKGRKELHTYTKPKKFELTDKDRAYIKKEVSRICPSKPCDNKGRDSLGAQLDCINYCGIGVEDELILLLKRKRSNERTIVEEYRNVRGCEDEPQTKQVLGIEKGDVRKRFRY
jgi:hypothetical protein